MFLAGSRFIFLLMFLASSTVLSVSLYLEYGPGLKPCSLCWVQRFFLLAFCIVNLIAYAHASRPKRVMSYSIVSLVLAFAGAMSAVRQVILLRVPPEQLMFCQPDFICMLHNFSLKTALSALFRGSEECVHVSWTVFGLSIPELSLLAFTGLCLLSITQLIRTVVSRMHSAPCDPA